MKIGFVLPGNFALSPDGQGIRIQAVEQAKALNELGVDVGLLNPWDPCPKNVYDVIQFFRGGLAHANIESAARSVAKAVCFAPIIDTNASWRSYALMSKVSYGNRLVSAPSLFRQQGQSADAVVVRSEHEFDRMSKSLGVDEKKIHIVLNGVETSFDPVDPDIARKFFDLPGDFIFHASAYSQPRKNVARMIEAIGPTGLDLVICGRPEENAQMAKIRQLQQQFKNVRVFEFLDLEVLNSAYAAAKVFCLPSIHEGTGLAALEAAVRGAGVVITEHGGPPDYFGSAAYYVDPHSVDSIRNAVLAAWANPRSEPLQQHLSNLTWTQSAKSLIQVYENCLRSR